MQYASNITINIAQCNNIAKEKYIADACLVIFVIYCNIALL